MSIFRMLKLTRGIQDPPPDRSEIESDYARAVQTLGNVIGNPDTIEAVPSGGLEVPIFGHVVRDDPDGARDKIRTLSRPELGLLLFYAGELSRLVSEEDMFRTDTDRRAARRTYDDNLSPDNG